MSEPLIVGIDHGSGDWSAVAMIQQQRDKHVVLAMEAIRDYAADRIDWLVNKMYRDVSRPAGYSQSHWRKLWKQRSPVRVTDHE